MSLKKPNQEDLRKLHSEINQIINQRFQLATAAITIFGVVVAWLLPNEQKSAGSSVGSFTFAGSLLILILLSLLFALSRLLTGMLRVISTYLIVTDGSSWENDWQHYREEGAHLGYTRPQSIVFFVVGLLATAVPFLIAWFYSLTLEPSVGSYLVVICGLLYLAAVVIFGFLNFGDGEKKSLRKWSALNNKSRSAALPDQETST